MLVKKTRELLVAITLFATEPGLATSIYKTPPPGARLSARPLGKMPYEVTPVMPEKTDLILQI